MIAWVLGGVWAAASRRPVPLAHPPRPLRGGAGRGEVSRLKDFASGGGPSLGESRGFMGAGVGGAGWGSGWSGRRVCSLLVRAPEAIRNLPGGQAAEASRCAVSCIAPLDLPAGP